MKINSRIGIIMCLAILLLNVKAFSQKNNWKHFSSSQFPSYVVEIDFEDGLSISPTTGIKWGSWTITFKKDTLPTLQVLTQAPSGDQVGFQIWNLEAHNDISGTCVCSMMYEYSDGGWRLYIPLKNSTISIAAPVTVKLKQ